MNVKGGGVLVLRLSCGSVINTTLCFLHVGKELSLINQRYIAAALDKTFRPEPRGEDSSERYLRMRHNVFAAVAASVQPSTQDTYATGWRRWVDYCNWFEVDPFLRVVPRAWVTPEGEIPVDFRQMAVIAFMQKLCIAEKLCPGTVSVYMAAVRYYLKLANLDIAFLEAPWVSSARTAMTLLFRKDNPIAGRKGLPFTCDMIVHAELKTFNTNSPTDHAILTAKKLASTCLMRVSEYLPGSPEVDHWARSQDVCFRVIDDSIVPSWRAIGTPIEDVVSTIVTVRGGKNDVSGEGHCMEFMKAAVGKNCAYCIVTSLHSWAVRAQPLFGQPFLSWRGEWVLSYDRLSKAIKRVASEMGLNPNRYRTHSLRIGGASMLAAAGRPDYEIQKLGRWKSLAFLEYIRLGKATFTAALAAIVNPNLLTAKEVGRMSAGSGA